VTKSSNNTPWTTLHRNQFDDSSGSMAPDWTADTANSGDSLSGDAAVFYSSPDGGSTAFTAPPSTSPSQAAASLSAQNSPYSTIAVTSGGMTINLEFVMADNPTASFESDVEAAATILAAAIHNKITVNITVGYGEVDGETLTNGEAAAGPDLTGGAISDSYSTVRADLIANAAPGDTNFNALPNGSSISGQSSVVVYTSQQKLFGQLSATGTEIDGGAGFATDVQTITGKDVLVGVALHELTHAIGRVPTGPEPNIFDFYRFTSPGTWLFSNNIPSAAAYFSVNGGNTKLADYGQNSDPSDFLNPPNSNLTPEDPFNEFYDSNTIQHLTTVDLTQLDVLGFNTITATGPVVTTGNPTVTFTGGGSAVTLDNAVTITDQESTTLASATVSVGGFLGGDTLNFTNQNGITGSYNSGTAVLTLSGTASLANYQTALDSITYSFTPSNGDPTGLGTDTSRTIHWVVNDGVASSPTATSTLDTVHAAPTVVAGATATYTGGGPAVTLDGALTASDPDSGGNLTGAKVSIGTGFLSGDTLHFTNQNGITGNYVSGTGVLTLSGTTSLANYQAALESITFDSTSGNPSNSGSDRSRTVNWTVSDGISSSNTVTSTINVVPATPAGTSADMILRDSNNGIYDIYDIGGNAILAAYLLGQVGTEWQVAGLGGFNGTDTADMILRDSNNGAFEVYDISNNTITSFAAPGTVGLEWKVAGFGDLSGNVNETDMLLRNSNTGAFEIYDIGNNQFTGFHAMGQVGLEWTVAGFGDFSGNANESDMLLRNSNTGAFEVYDISHNAITSAASMGAVGLEWTVAGFGDFSGNSGETDMLLRSSNTGAFEVYDISHNAITSAASMGAVGLEWTVAGFGDLSGNANETDILMRNSNTGAFAVYDISHNAITSATAMGTVGLEWQVGGIAADPPTSSSSASTARLVEAIASFGASGAVNGAPGAVTDGADMSQQILLTMLQHT
jgi:hypothetical protein